MMRLPLILLLIAAPSLAGQSEVSPLSIKLRELREFANANFARLNTLSTQLREKRAPTADWDRFWNERNYWYYFVSAVDDLARSSFRKVEGPSASARLEAVQKASRELGITAELLPDGTISFKPGSTTYEKRKAAVKNSAEIALYSQILSYDLVSGAVLIGSDGGPVKPAALAE